MTLSELKAMGEMAIEYFKDKQAKGYSQAEVIKEILSKSEGETKGSVKSWVQRTTKKMNIQFTNGNEKRKLNNNININIIPIKELNTTKTTQDVPQEKTPISVVKEVEPQSIPQEVPQHKNELYLELLERVEKLEQTFNNKPTEPQETILEGKYINSGIRVNEGIWKAFNEFCASSKESKQVLITKAFYEYMENHK